MNRGYSPQLHWGNVWNGRDPEQTSWYEEHPSVSLDMIEAVAPDREASILDVGGGASTLVDHLLEAGFDDLTVLDIASESLEKAQQRLGPDAERVTWRVGDVTRVDLERTFDVWHDRAVFHFLADPGDQAAYRRQITEAVPVGGHAILATFALDGPAMCSGLPVERYDAPAIAEAMGEAFDLVDDRHVIHTTPWEAEQAFQYALLERV